jgi:transposase-like protein
MEKLETKGIGALAAGPEGARSATGGAGASAAATTVEVVDKARRRQFSAAYKARILREAEACAGSGQIGALLRREGLYSSHLSEWRRLRARGALEALAAKKRGKKPSRDARDLELARLARENARLRRKLAQAEAVIEVQKKLSEILEIPLQGSGRDASEE